MEKKHNQRKKKPFKWFSVHSVLQYGQCMCKENFPGVISMQSYGTVLLLTLLLMIFINL